MKHPISTLLTALSVGILVWVAFAPGMSWTGGVMKPFTVRLTQGDSKTPLQGITVLFMRNSEADQFPHLSELKRSEWLEALMSSKMMDRTSADGLVNLRGQFGAGGNSSLLWNRGSYSATGSLLILKDDGTVVRHELEDLLPPEKRSLNTDLPKIEITLP
jgi:hypothetical protein